MEAGEEPQQRRKEGGQARASSSPLVADHCEIAAGVGGGLGLAPSADLGKDVGMFQCSPDTAADIAGLIVAKPAVVILSVTMLLDWLTSRPRMRDLGDAGPQEVTYATLVALLV